MKWLSDSVESLICGPDRERAFEVIVVGSGYGGAVAAYRFAEAGYSVCVLERGEEYVPGEFPNDLSNIAKHVRLERSDRAGVTGRREGLFDVRLHGTVTTLVGNALGGTSQINANVAMQADPQLFKEPCWPQAVP